MRKRFVLFLVVLVVGSIALATLACGGEEKTVTAVTTEAASAALSCGEAKNNVGATGLWLTRPVLDVKDKGFKYIIPIGTEEDNLNLAISYEDADKSGGADALNALFGKTTHVSTARAHKTAVSSTTVVG